MSQWQSDEGVKLNLGDWTLRPTLVPRHIIIMLDGLVDDWDADDPAGNDRESVLESLIVSAWVAQGRKLSEIYTEDGTPIHSITWRD